jgi:hypothetical protein
MKGAVRAAHSLPPVTGADRKGPHFSANPIGVEYDPDVWLARLRAGVPASEFLARHIDEPISPIRDAEMIGAPAGD